MSWVPYLTMFLLMVCGLLLIFIILLQRGRGGGLAGALGGMGGQSAFGTKAGDVFTKITVVLAIIWVVLAAGNVYALRGFSGSKFKGGSSAVPTASSLDDDGTAEGQGDDLNLPEAGGDATPTTGDQKPAAPATTTDDNAANSAAKSDSAAPQSDESKAAPEATAPKTEATDAPAETPKQPE